MLRLRRDDGVGLGGYHPERSWPVVEQQRNKFLHEDCIDRVTWGMAPTWGKTPMASFSYVIAVLLKSELVKYVTSAAYWIYINVRVDFYLSSWWRIRLRFRLKHYKIVISNIRDCDSVARTFENLTLNRFKRCMRRWFYAWILRISHTTDVYEYIT